MARMELGMGLGLGLLWMGMGLGRWLGMGLGIWLVLVDAVLGLAILLVRPMALRGRCPGSLRA